MRLSCSLSLAVESSMFSLVRSLSAKAGSAYSQEPLWAWLVLDTLCSSTFLPLSPRQTCVTPMLAGVPNKSRSRSSRSLELTRGWRLMNPRVRLCGEKAQLEATGSNSTACYWCTTCTCQTKKWTGQRADSELVGPCTFGSCIRDGTRGKGGKGDSSGYFYIELQRDSAHLGLGNGNRFVFKVCMARIFQKNLRHQRCFVLVRGYSLAF